MLAATPHHACSDEDLAERAHRGERAAFVVLVARYRDRVYRLALRMSRNPSDAEEVAQETFLHAYKAIGTFQGESRFGTWLYRIAFNEVLMRRRSQSRHPSESLEVVFPDFADLGFADGSPAARRADDVAHAKTLAVRVTAALEQLEPDQRSAFVLRDLEELSAERAATILGISPEATRQRAHRARLRLRELLADVLSEPG